MIKKHHIEMVSSLPQQPTSFLKSSSIASYEYTNPNLLPPSHTPVYSLRINLQNHHGRESHQLDTSKADRSSIKKRPAKTHICFHHGIEHIKSLRSPNTTKHQFPSVSRSHKSKRFKAKVQTPPLKSPQGCEGVFPLVELEPFASPLTGVGAIRLFFLSPPSRSSLSLSL